MSHFAASSGAVTALAAIALACATAQAQSRAVLWNGTIVTQKQPLEFFFTEGPIHSLDIAGRQILSSGKSVHIPRRIDGVQTAIAGTELLDAQGISIGPVTAATFGRLADSSAVASRDFNSVGFGLGPRRLGPVRSIFSSAEAVRTAPVGSTLLREPAAQVTVRDTFWNALQSTHALHSEVLPADFLEIAGMVGTDPSNWIYPSMVGGTLKSAGHVYVDTNRNEYFVPDAGLVFEFAENLTTGTITSLKPGSATTPDSFVIDDSMLVIMNPDPRVPSEVFGVGLSPLTRERFFQAVVEGQTQCEIAGYFTADNVFFAQEVVVPTIFEPAGDVTLIAENFRIRADRGEMRFLGFIDNFHGLDVFVIVGSQEFQQLLEIDPLVPNCRIFNFRQRGLPNLANLTEVRIEARDQAGGFVLASITYDVTEFIQ